MNPAGHPLHAEVREAVAAALRRGVILSIDLGLQSKQAHWTLRGPSFIALHELFDDIAAANEYADLCTERLMAAWRSRRRHERNRDGRLGITYTY